jgi:Peptidase S24-like
MSHNTAAAGALCSMNTLCSASAPCSMNSSASFHALCEQLLTSGHTARFSASGHSMRPTILDGDILTVEPLAAAQTRCGQILLVRTDGKLRAHRVVTTHPVLITRGDAGLENDAPVEVVLGQVTALQRGAKTVSLQGRTRVLRQRLRLAIFRVQQAWRLNRPGRRGTR